MATLSDRTRDTAGNGLPPGLAPVTRLPTSSPGPDDDAFSLAAMLQTLAEGRWLILGTIVALSVPIGDTLLAMTRRVVRGQPVFSSDRGHIHHRLMDRGLSHRAAVLALWGLATVVAFVAVGLVHADAEQTVAYFGALLTIGIMLLASTGYVRFDQTRKVLSDRKHNLAMRSAVREAGERIRHAHAVDEVWEATREAAEELGACCASLVVVTRNGTSHRSEFSWGFESTPPGVVRGRFSLLGERPDDGRLELGFRDGRTTIDRDTEIAIEMLCEHVHAAAERISGRRHAEASGDRTVVNLRK
jgi:UDP-GlcNAc:undecaprenyl-phosphate/decaprenyl-phosphate GlcNAc-1-phosphate transferase